MLRVDLDSITPRQESAWRDLAADAVEPNVFFEADYVLAAARAFGLESEVYLLVDGTEERWNGCIPVKEKRVLTYPRIVSTWKHLYSFLGTPLVRRGEEQRFATALLQAVGTRQTGLLLSLRDVAEGPVLEALSAARPRLGVRMIRAVRTERAALRPAEHGDDAIVPNKRRDKDLARRRRGLTKKLGQTEEVSTRTRANDAATVEEFLRLEAAGWKGRAGTALASDPRHAEFFRTICAWLGKEDRLWLRSLGTDERVAAMSCEFISGAEMSGFKIAFDEDLRSSAPGVLLAVDNFADINATDRFELYDSCADPTNEMVNSLLPDRRAIWSLVFARDDALGRAGGRALKVRGALRARRS
jgi:CelD/BcsL family acetyltransferase involved in cellulose biosynthesis